MGKIKNYIKKKLTKKEYIPTIIPAVKGEILKDKVALITGASSGIGYGIAEAFLNEGASVIITGRNESKLIEACDKLKSIGGGIQYIVWNHSRIDDLDEKINVAIKLFGRIDILVNNAGYHGNQNFFTVSESDFDNTFNVNVKTVFFLSQKIAMYMKDNNIKGHICNISSASSAKPAWSPYEISKWACSGFTKGLAREVVQYGITVNGIAPGPIATAMSHWQEGDSLSWPGLPKGRLGLINEIGNLAVYLCSDLGDFIVGEIVHCDGGSGTITSNK